MITAAIRLRRICTVVSGALTLAILWSLSWTPQAFGQDKQLFRAWEQPAAKLAVKQRNALSKLKASKGRNFIKLIKIDNAMIGKENLDLDLAPNVKLKTKKGVVTRKAANKLIWTAPLTAKGSRAVFVANGDNVTGTISTADGVYQVRPLSGGIHAVVKMDPSKLPPDHPSSFADIERRPAQVAIGPQVAFEIGAVRVIEPTTIRVLVAYTPSVAAAVADVEGLIDLAVAETNQSYANSGVLARLSLVDTYQVSYTESGSFSTDLTKFRTNGDGVMDEVHTHRNDHCADVAVLLINNTAYCGLASAIMADTDTAFVAVHYDCATGYYSFGHEIGHLQGARHDPDTDPTNTPFPYGHGYRHPPQFRTVMAYNCPGNCSRYDNWSNPNVSLMGFPTGTADRCDNHRVLNETRATVAAFKSSVTCLRIAWPQYQQLTALCATLGCGANIQGVEQHINPSPDFARVIKGGGAKAAQAAKLRNKAGALFQKADGASEAQRAAIEKEAAALNEQFDKLLKQTRVVKPLVKPIRKESSSLRTDKKPILRSVKQPIKK